MSSGQTLLGMPNVGGLGGSAEYFLAPEYSLPTPRNGARIQRRWVKRDITTAMPVTNENPLLRWQVPNDGVKILDFRRATVYISFSCNVLPATLSVRPSALMWNLVDRFRLEQSGQYVEDRRFFNLQETVAYRTGTHINQQVTTGVALYGDGSASLRQFRSGGWKYALPIPSTALTKTILPWYLVGQDGRAAAIPEVWLQWELAKPEAFLEVTGAGPISSLTYTITRVQIEYEEIYGVGGNNFITRDWNPSPGRYPKICYKSFMSSQYALTSALEQTIPFEYKLSSIVAIYVTFIDSNNVNNPFGIDKFETWLGRNDLPLTNYQFEVNSTLWPDTPVNLQDPSFVEAYLMYQRAYQMYHSRVIQQEVTPITISDFLSNKFVLVCDINQNPLSANIINPVSTRNSTSNILLKLTFSAPPSPGLLCIAHFLHWRAWNYGAVGNVPLIEQ